MKFKNMRRGNSQQSTVDSRQTKAEGKRRKAEDSPFSSFILHLSSFRLGTLPLALAALLALAILAFIAWFPKPPPKPDATWVQILETGAWRIGIDPSFPPFESDDAKGNLSGLDIALADEIAREWASANETPIHA
ncbi:MAG: hypothetical protein L0Y55_03100, partial [Anaerolineales bacterium]|nr:hypothetical protein [Anaerolineales bacterium]